MIENFGFFDAAYPASSGASPQTPEIFLGMAPVFNDCHVRPRNTKLYLAG